MFARMREPIYEISCSVYLGVAGIFMYTGYNLQSFIIEPVLHSVNGRAPERIGPYDGYYGLAATDITYCISNFFVASYLNYLIPKWLIIIGSVLFMAYFTTFLYLHRIIYFVACIAVGTASSMYNAGYSGYITEFSSRKSIARNQAIFWSTNSLSMFIAGVIFFVISKTTLGDPKPGDETKFRVYSDEEIRIFFGALSVISTVGVIMHVFLPLRRVDHCIADEHEQEKTTFMVKMAEMLRAMKHPRIILLIPFYVYVGAFFCFWGTVYPTSLQFTKALAGDVYLPAYYGMVFSIGNLTMGVLTMVLSRLIDGFDLRPLLLFNVCIHAVIFVLVLFSVPQSSTFAPTDEESLLIAPNRWLALVIAFLFGLADHANNTLRTVLTSVALPKRRDQAFACARLYHAVAGFTLFLLSPSLTSLHYVIGLGVICAVSAVAFWMVASQVIADSERGDERKAALSRGESEDAPPPGMTHLALVENKP